MKLRVRLSRAGYQLEVNLGLTLFSAGMACTSGAWWERTLWILLALAFAFYAWRGSGS